MVREELANAGQGVTGRVVPVNNTARPYELDARTEERVLGRMTELVQASQQRQQMELGNYLFKVAQEDGVRRRDSEIRSGQLKAQIVQLQAVASLLVLAQA